MPAAVFGEVAMSSSQKGRRDESDMKDLKDER